MRDPLIDRCVDVYTAHTDADFNDLEAMAAVFYYLSEELAWNIPGVSDENWSGYFEGRTDICRTLRDEASTILEAMND